ncbi:hypothetical protein [Bradyrhizobium yuanmingense]|uniref:Uncharacterized protein n=1 Tax=Bradyrhizobium yuanmingense TaxID=108015 RepID=A0ABV4GD12_9BRAD|nr:hypothetical protein [Bradyrhizobium yuanmingense]
MPFQAGLEAVDEDPCAGPTLGLLRSAERLLPPRKTAGFRTKFQEVFNRVL